MSQFAFLKPEWPDLHEAAARAEALALSDPRAATFYARRALEELATLRRGRKALAEPVQLRGLADQIERARAVLAACPPPNRTNEYDESGTNEPEPTTPPEKRTNGFISAGTNEPRHPVPPLAADLFSVPATSLNRHGRRRLAALERRAA